MIAIKWNKILSITSDKVFDIELVDGTHIFGALAPSSPPGKLAVESEGDVARRSNTSTWPA